MTSDVRTVGDLGGTDADVSPEMTGMSASDARLAVRAIALLTPDATLT